MKYRSWTGLIAMLLISFPVWSQQGNSGSIKDYIERYKDWAMEEQVRTGVPAAITLAQGICESGAGTSELSQKANNHFGIKCKHNWQGQTYSYDDDHKSECFRKYENDLHSFKDHSDFLRNNPRYASLFELKVTDYKKWAEGLKKAGYATNKHYAKILIGYIQDYNLEQYTKQALSGKIRSEKAIDEKNSTLLADSEDNSAVFSTSSDGSMAHSLSVQTTTNEAERTVEYYVTTRKNGLKGFYARKGDLLLEYAISHQIRYGKILAWNDLKDEPLASDMFIYLEKKRKRGIQPFFEVQPGMDLHQVSQATGVALEELRLLNQLNEGEEPIAGTKLALQQPAEQKVATSLNRNEVMPENKALPVSRKEESNEEAQYVYLRSNKEEEQDDAIVVSDEDKASSGKESVLERNDDEVLTQHVAVEAEEQGTISSESIVQNTTTLEEPREEHNTVIPTEEESSNSSPEKELTQTEKLRAMMDKIVYDNKSRTEEKEQEKDDEVNETPTEKLRAFMETVDARRKEQKEEAYTTLPPGQSAQKSSAESATTKVKYYTVKRGDTAYSIAKRFGISLKQLKEWNRLPASMTVPLGAKIRVSQ